MSTLRPTAIIVTAFLAGAALAEVGVRATGAFRHDGLGIVRTPAVAPAPVCPARGGDAPPRCPFAAAL